MDKNVPNVSDYNGKTTIFSIRLDDSKHTFITGTTKYKHATVTRNFNIDCSTSHLVQTITDSYTDGMINEEHKLAPLNNNPIPGKQIIGDEAIAVFGDEYKAGSIRMRDYAFNEHFKKPPEWENEKPDSERVKHKEKITTNCTHDFESRQLQPKQSAHGWNITVSYIPINKGMEVTSVIVSPTGNIKTSHYTLKRNTVTVSTPLHIEPKIYRLNEQNEVPVNENTFKHRNVMFDSLSFPVFAWYHTFEVINELYFGTKTHINQGYDCATNR